MKVPGYLRRILRPQGFIGLVVILFASAAAGQSGPVAGQCDKENAAYDEVRLRAIASQTSLELLREYSKALDESYEATRRSAYHDSSVDVASLAAGWPLGKGIQEYFLGKAKDKFTEKLVKAGFKSVEKALLKDPSLNGMFENAVSPVSSTSGMQYDLVKEYYKKLSKEMLGDTAGESVTSVLDLMKFGLTAYKGMKKLDAIRALARSTNEQIAQLTGKHMEQMDVFDSAQRARELCYDRLAKNLPPDTSNRFWTDVLDYLGPNWKAPGLNDSGTTSSPSRDARFVGTWSCECKVQLIFDSNGMGAWVDSRGGPSGSMYESGRYDGYWNSSGNTLTLTLSKGSNPNRFGTVGFQLKEGKLFGLGMALTR